ncbi:MAG: hypothetical protein LBL90_08610 [Prevotellaceae bacterium]|jgi:hypothetical protein|nr:hypothetical protein [Prevotellaceae bacterium]
MKKIVVFMLCLVLLSCASTRKSVQTISTNDSFIQSNESQSAKVDKVIDTTKTENGKITITEIEFYPPNGSDTVNHTPAINVGGVDIPNIGNIDNAAIKSIKQTTIESESETKGESKESSSTEINKNESAVANTEKTVMIDEEPAPDPYKWRYIFYILLVGVIAFLYLKRVPILNWIKTIISGIRKVFLFFL